MATRGGPWVTGTDGSDFSHRQKVASHYHVSALYKQRLRFCIFMHSLLFLVMCAKLLEDVLDRLDVFILEIEELYIPKPLIWEWIWLGGIVFAFVGLSAARRNKLSSIKIYAVGTFLFGLCPVIGAGVYFFSEMWEYAETRDSSNLEQWQGYPLAVLWYIFITLSSQVHLFSLYFAIKLIRAWRLKSSNKKIN
ncbi:protein jagunal-like [Limulus polyphemus]|uniref:Protein jagunal-like n=1 Tax=Limulus polyphemus TaxID=6850 RepID=A0ABM1BU53_LIMPO|nr:protein jagunal-like [Limulus polyphemus]